MRLRMKFIIDCAEQFTFAVLYFILLILLIFMFRSEADRQRGRPLKFEIQ